MLAKTIKMSDIVEHRRFPGVIGKVMDIIHYEEADEYSDEIVEFDMLYVRTVIATKHWCLDNCVKVVE